MKVHTMKSPTNIQLIGQEIAIVWDDGSESYYACDRLRAVSPSAETQGERDILGQTHGGHEPRKFAGVTITGWDIVGNYAIRFTFSDGHRTGIYSYDYLQRIDASN